MDLGSHGVVILIPDKEGKYLLLKEARDLLQDHWAPPHGRGDKRDPSEEYTVRREAHEETGLHVVPVKKLLTIPADTKVKTVSFWLAVCEDLEALHVDPREAADHGWFTPKEALTLTLYPGTRHFLERVESGEIKLD